MNSCLTMLTAVALMLTAAAQAGQAFPAAKAELEQVLTCRKSATPEQFASLITALGGHRIMQSASLADAQYSLPNPLDIFGFQVKNLSFHGEGNGVGDDSSSYSAVFFDTPIELLSKISEVPLDSDGFYRKKVGNHDLVLHSEMDVAYVSCVNDVRSIAKSIQRIIGWK